MIIATLIAEKAASLATVAVLGTTTAAVATGMVLLDVNAAEAPEPAVIVADAPEPIETISTAPGSTDEPVLPIDDDLDDETTEDETVEDEAEDVGPADADGTPYGDVACADAVNHGQYVSGVARDSDVADAEGNRGSIVSQAAKTDCGKSDDEATSSDDDTDELDESEDHESDDRDANEDASGESKKDAKDEKASERPGNSGNSGNNGRGNGKGNDK